MEKKPDDFFGYQFQNAEKARNSLIKFNEDLKKLKGNNITINSHLGHGNFINVLDQIARTYEAKEIDDQVYVHLCDFITNATRVVDDVYKYREDFTKSIEIEKKRTTSLNNHRRFEETKEWLFKNVKWIGGAFVVVLAYSAFTYKTDPCSKDSFWKLPIKDLIVECPANIQQDSNAPASPKILSPAIKGKLLIENIKEE